MERFRRVRQIHDEAVGGPDASEDVPPPGELTWRATKAPLASSRTDDIWFSDPQRGWAVNSNGQILHTGNGFTTWEKPFHDPRVYFRCIGFASESRGSTGTPPTTPASRWPAAALSSQ